jgi:hypothetical protein
MKAVATVPTDLKAVYNDTISGIYNSAAKDMALEIIERYWRLTENLTFINENYLPFL